MSRQVNVVNWFEIYVQDIDRARKFYETVLGETMTEMEVPTDGIDDKSVRLVAFPFAENSINASGALVQAAGVPSGGNGTMVYFTCEDCEIEQSRVEGAGGKVLSPKFAIGQFGFCAICSDTEGNAFGLHSMK